MAEYNPSKIIKDGNTYNFRDTTKIPLAGSNQISGSLIPSTDGTVNLGSPNYQWNNAYIKSLTINGVVCGDILTHNVSEFVNVTGAQTIGGVKTFSSNVIIQGSKKVTCNLDNSFIELDGGTTWGKGGSIVLSGQDRSSYTNSVLIVSKSDTNTDILQYQNGELKPLSNNTNNSSLGTSTNKWSKVYSDDVVHTTDNETISGVKTFSDGLFASKSGQGDLAVLVDDSINSANEDTDGMPLTGHTNALKIRGRDNNILPCMLVGQIYTNGDTGAQLRTYKYKDLTSNAMIQLRYSYNNGEGTVTFSYISYILPNVTNKANLGSPSSQWNNTYTRNILIDNDISIASSLINKTSNSGVLTMRGGISDTEGASLSLYGKDYGGSPGLIGNIYMTAYGSSDYTNFRIYPNGIIRVYNNSTATTKNVAMQEDVVPRSGGAVMTGDLLASPTTNSIGFGYGWGNGGTIYTYSPTHSTAEWQGTIRLEPLKTTSNFKTMTFAPDGTWTWNGTACQITSDQRYKQQITEIDDKLLDAWQDVELSQFKYNDAVNEKGNNARLHTGYVVQQIDEACKSHGIDISAYGLYCHEEYPEETKEIEVEQADGTKTKETKVIREASEHYSLRYTEALIVECKYLRRCIARLTARIEELEEGNNVK